jgi:hypothetical protein
MVHKPNGRETLYQDPIDDDLGSLVRWGLEDTFAEASPPDDLWPKIRAQIEAQSDTKPVSHAGVRRRSLSLASLVQTVVVSSLVLAFVLEVDRTGSSSPRPSADRTPVVEHSIFDSGPPRDIPRLRPVADPEPQQAVHRRMGGATQ